MRASPWQRPSARLRAIRSSTAFAPRSSNTSPTMESIFNPVPSIPRKHFPRSAAGGSQAIRARLASGACRSRSRGGPRLLDRALDACRSSGGKAPRPHRDLFFGMAAACTSVARCHRRRHPNACGNPRRGLRRSTSGEPGYRVSRHRSIRGDDCCDRDAPAVSKWRGNAIRRVRRIAPARCETSDLLGGSGDRSRRSVRLSRAADHEL